ncbi:hypothetical protein A1D29_01875 [Pasteurellaceae bacterium Orientalotternb1]|nr:hypothetical protein A1D29_01875 [Pasteurellaceae bacterium Orientalotternb1]
METINIHQAKTHLSRIVDNVVLHQQPVIIAKAGKPQVQIVPLPDVQPKRKMGTLKGKITIPENFDELFNDEIAQHFAGESE